MDSNFSKIFEQTSAQKEIKQIALPVPRSDLSPVLSKENIDIHYGVLYRKYVDKSHEGAGAFFKAGAQLHTLFFEQLQSPVTGNQPTGEIKDLIEKRFDSYAQFRTEIIEKSLELQGSGWSYLSTSGTIKLIHNHEYKPDILLLIDLWEHSYFTDYGADREKYLKNFFRIIDWSVINSRFKNV